MVADRAGARAERGVRKKGVPPRVEENPVEASESGGELLLVQVKRRGSQAVTIPPQLSSASLTVKVERRPGRKEASLKESR